MNRNTEIVREGYNRLGFDYERWVASVRIEERQEYLAKVEDHFSDGSRILDIGCGNGNLNTQHLARRFDVVGVDLSEHQIGIEKKNLPNVQFNCADISNYDFEPDSFDGIDVRMV
jgi:SAM-dependent methyltransferase